MREPTIEEDRIIRFLISKSCAEHAMDVRLGPYMVQEMQDGGMGSLYIIPKAIASKTERETGPMVAEFHANDIDDIEMVISLFLDTDLTPFELDIWKVDFSPLRSLSQVIKDIEPLSKK